MLPKVRLRSRGGYAETAGTKSESAPLVGGAGKFSWLCVSSAIAHVRAALTPLHSWASRVAFAP